MSRAHNRSYVVLAGLMVALIAVSSLFNIAAHGARASSHREAPNISQDPTADNTDVYAFVSPDKPDTVTMIADYYPGEDPAGGPNFYSFGDDVAYDLKIDNNHDAVEDITYRFQFFTKIMNPDVPLYNTGPIESLDSKNWNIRQRIQRHQDHQGRQRAARVRRRGPAGQHRPNLDSELQETRQ